MTKHETTIEADYFDQLYSDNHDPWDFENSPYEREKYAATLSLLKAQAYKSALEIGCSIGLLTSQLAGHCAELLAIDASEVALTYARARNLSQTVRFEKRMVPADFPDGRFDLIVLSEVLYYLTVDDLSVLARQCMEALMPDGDIILCHWLGETNYPLSGTDASDRFANAVKPKAPERMIVRDHIYRLERLSVSQGSHFARR